MGALTGAANLYFLYKFIRILTTPWEETDAYKLGIIDEDGKILIKKKKLKGSEQKEAYTMMHLFTWKIKRLLEKIPFGKSRVAKYAAALWFIKEGKAFTDDSDEQLIQESLLSFLETDWKNDALILKENYEGDMDKKTFSNLREAKSCGTKLPPHLAKFFDKKGNLTKAAADRVKKGRKERGVKITDRTPDWMFKEKAPPGWENTVKKMKKHKDIENPYALAWYMANKGDKPEEWEKHTIGEKMISFKDFNESTKEYAKSLKKMANDRALKMLTKSERENLKKIADLLSKEKREELGIDEGMKKSTMYGIVKGTQEKGKVVFKGNKRTALKKLRANEFGSNTILINSPSAKVGDKWGKGKTEEFELDEATVLQITDVDQWTMDIYKGIKAGWKSVAKSTLGGDENVAILIKLTLEPEKEWPNKILHNATYAMIRIATDGTMEMFASERSVKNMRKTRVRSAKDVVNKINAWIKKVDEDFVMEGDQIDEAYFKVSIPNMPAIYIEGGGESGVRQSLRGTLKSDVFKSVQVEKVKKSEILKTFKADLKGKNEEVDINEVYFRVSIPELPPIFVEGDKAKIKKSFRQKLKSKVIKDVEIERVSKTEMRNKYREMAKGKNDEEDVDEGVELTEALKPIDKSVVDAFYYKKEKAGKLVSTDGDSLWKNGMGGQEIAKWSGRKIKITAVSDVKSTESIIKYMKKSIPTGNFKEAYSFSMFIEDHECPKCNGKGCEHCDGKGYHTEAKEREITHQEYIKTGKSKGGRNWTTGQGKNLKYWTHRKEEVEMEEEVKESSKFSSFMKEGRPALDPDYVPGITSTDRERTKLVDSQQRKYNVKEIESIARKHKVKLSKEEEPLKFGNEWTIVTAKGITLIYDERTNGTTVSGWKVKKDKLRAYKDRYEQEHTRMQDVLPMRGRLDLRGFESAFELIGEETLNEEVPANSVAGGGVNLDPFKKKKIRKNAKVKTEDFAGKKVFVVSPDKFWNARMGKSRYSRYEKYVGNDKLGEAIRQYGRENPKSPIILKNSENGAMLYLKYGGRI